MTLQHIGAGAGRLLAEGTLKGHWTLEDLDTPPSYWAGLERDRARSFTPQSPGSGLPTMRLPDAGQIRPYRNLAREWIAANPGEWQRLMAKHLAAEPQTRPAPPVIQLEPDGELKNQFSEKAKNAKPRKSLWSQSL